jgi:FtsH-binding integral membrane protein
MASIYPKQPAAQELDTLFNETFASVMRHVYLWMCLGLFVTAFTSIALIYTPLFYVLAQLLQVPFLFYGLLIGELILVVVLTAKIDKISIISSRLWFLLYALLNGITMSVIFLVYTDSSIAMTFITTATVFGFMSFIGYTTKLDLSKWGSYLLMGLVGFIVGSLINLFFAVSTLEWILTYVGIALFLGLTVYDTQRIKNILAGAMQSGDETLAKRMGLLGALHLYLDFINLFLLLLRIFGRRK